MVGTFICISAALTWTWARSAAGSPSPATSGTQQKMSLVCSYNSQLTLELEWQHSIHTKGQSEKWLQDSSTLVTGVFVGIALLQICGICLAQNLVNAIKVVKASQWGCHTGAQGASIPTPAGWWAPKRIGKGIAERVWARWGGRGLPCPHPGWDTLLCMAVWGRLGACCCLGHSFMKQLQSCLLY